MSQKTIIGLFSLLFVTGASADVKSLTSADVAGLAEQAIKSLDGCEGLKGVTQVESITVTNKTDEHLDKKMIEAAVAKELKKHKKIVVKTGAKEKVLGKIEVNSKKSQVGNSYDAEYELKADFTNDEGVTACWSTATLKKHQ